MARTKQPDVIAPSDFIRMKLSDAVPLVIQDMDNFLKEGVTLYTRSWAKVDESTEKVCSVCVGGAAVLSFYPKKLRYKAVCNGLYLPGVLDIGLVDTGRIKHTFDSIRCAAYCDAFQIWHGKMCHEPLYSILGVLSDTHSVIYAATRNAKSPVYRQLVRQMTELASVLREHGY